MAPSSWGIWRRARSRRCRAGCCASSSGRRRRERAMRIIGGRHRGRRLAAPEGLAIRPTAERAREALFDILGHGRFAEQPVWLGARVLDAFAGTGAFGLEALSRGAEHASFMEKDRAARAALLGNVRT